MLKLLREITKEVFLRVTKNHSRISISKFSLGVRLYFLCIKLDLSKASKNIDYSI